MKLRNLFLLLTIFIGVNAGIYASTATTEQSSGLGNVWTLILLIIVGIVAFILIITKSKWKLDNLNIRTKIFVLGGSVLVIFAAVVGYTNVKLFSVGKGFTEVAELYLPLTKKMTAIETYQFEQVLALKDIYLAETKHQTDMVEKYEKEYSLLSEKVQNEILEAEKLIEVGEKYAINEEDLKYLDEALEHLKTIERKHANFDQNGERVINLLVEGKSKEADVLEENVAKEGMELTLELKNFLANVETRTDSLGNVVEEEQKAAVSAILSLSVIALSLTIFLSFFIANAIVKPIHRVVDMVKDIAEGEGDLTVRLEASSRDEIGELSRWFNVFLEKLQDIISQVKSSALQVGNASEQISSASEQLASGAEEQQAQLSEVAASIEEMSAMILEASKNTNDTQDNTQKANRAAEEGRAAVRNTISGIEEISGIVGSASDQIGTLEQRSQEIGEVIRVIDDIADQTNLLALNANIEAARAGDAGRGFAVVADEVRKLAERTVKATGEIGEQIKRIQADVSSSVDAMSKITEQSKTGQELASQSGEALERIATSIANVTRAMSQIASATDEQSSGAEEISKNVETISSVAREAASGAQELAASAEQLNSEVEGLNNLIGRFKV